MKNVKMIAKASWSVIEKQGIERATICLVAKRMYRLKL